tara:strand:+ start:182 stop:679 length:498 start_codon:yes stop_codon:yes gene_type:complete
MKTTLKIYPELRKKSKRTGLIPFYLRIIHKGVKSEGRLYTIEPLSEKNIRYWHQPTEQFSKGMDEYNDDIAIVKKAFREIKRNKTKYGNLSSKKIKEILMDDTPRVNKTMIRIVEDYYRNHIKEQSEYKIGTIKNKRKAINHLKNYLIATKIESCEVEEFYFIVR